MSFEPLNQTKIDPITTLSLSMLWTNKYLKQFKSLILFLKPQKSLNW